MSHPALMTMNLAMECSGSQCRGGAGSAPIRTSHAPVDKESGDLPLDSMLAEQVRQAIHQTGYFRLRNISIQVENDTVRLSGWVDCYYLKQLAQQKAMSIDGVRRIVNKLHVC